jgi:ketosteroid isomerase-like protein
MSQEKVEIVRRIYEPWNRGDVDAAFDFLNAEVEFSLRRNFPEAGPYRGRAEVRQLFTSQLAGGRLYALGCARPWQ